jgi:cytochrome c5
MRAMKALGLAVIVLCLAPLASTHTVAQQASPSTIDALTITDRAAVEVWSKATQGQQPLDPNTPAETEFLLSLTPIERVGAFRFKQRCIVCHGRQMSLAPNTWGPILTKANVSGREDAVRGRIRDGSARMPAFKYALDPAEIDAIVQYLKKVDVAPM